MTAQLQGEDLFKEGDEKEAIDQLSSLNIQVTVMGPEDNHADGMCKASSPSGRGL